MNKSKKVPLYGLVLTGGKSTRMKKDKSLLEYHGKKQVTYCFDLLSAFCQEVFVSNRKEQSSLSAHKRLPQIHDLFIDMGPLGGILSAMIQYPQVAWLVLACDLPFVQESTIKTLVHQRKPSQIATAYRSSHQPDLPEPLCAIYEPKALSILLQFLMQGFLCPRSILSRCDTWLITQKRRNSLDNVNSPAEYKKVFYSLRHG